MSNDEQAERAARAIYELDPLPRCGDGSWDALLAKAAEPGVAASIAGSIAKDRRTSARVALSAAGVDDLTEALDTCREQRTDTLELAADLTEEVETQRRVFREWQNEGREDMQAALDRAEAAERALADLRGQVHAWVDEATEHTSGLDLLRQIATPDPSTLAGDTTGAGAEASLPTPDGVKMTRETLCAAQVAVYCTVTEYDRRDEHGRRLQDLIDACDERRPLGPDGKHGDRHTPTCGCDRPAPDAREDREAVKALRTLMTEPMPPGTDFESAVWGASRLAQMLKVQPEPGRVQKCRWSAGICPDPWCPQHARCGLCGGEVIVMDDDPAFCPACGHDVMPARACATAGGEG